MTKKLEDLLNLPDSKEMIKEQKRSQPVVPDREETFREIDELDKIASALPAVKGLGQKADDELNEIADKAMAAYDDLMDLGMNVESRYASRVFEVAGGLLKTSLDAKVAKMDKKLKMIELQLKKQKMDNDGFNGDPSGFTEGAGYVVTDRNSLLERLKGFDKDK
jgi:hypothetical protein|tara:strand:+ start:662 stop:1153 length:492 start_codon:yes stop_codon:yes gene_type:complete